MKLLNILIFLLIFNTFILLGYLLSEMTGKAAYERVSVNLTRAIDGDTIDTEIGRVRLLGINTPEKNQPYHDEAMNYLKKYEGKMIELEERGNDKYDRTLGYIFENKNMLNSEILEQGLANLYVYDKDNYYDELESAEKKARDSEIGIWKKSKNYGCIKILKFQPIDKGNETESLILRNICQISLKIIIKDSANHIYNKEISAKSNLNL